MAIASRCFHCGAPFLKPLAEEPVCGHCGAARPTRGLTRPSAAVPRTPPNPERQRVTMLIVIGGAAAGMLFAGVLGFYLMSEGPTPRPSVPTPAPIARPTPQAERPPPPPPPEDSPPVQKPVATAPAPRPGVAKPAPREPRTNEAWGTQRLVKHLKQYDFCGKEAILRDPSIPRRYRLRAKFGAGGQGTQGRVDPSTPVAMLNACIDHTTGYVFLGKPPEARDFEVEISLSFAHLRPQGKPETRDDQWGIKGSK